MKEVTIQHGRETCGCDSGVRARARARGVCAACRQQRAHRRAGRGRVGAFRPASLEDGTNAGHHRAQNRRRTIFVPCFVRWSRGCGRWVPAAVAAMGRAAGGAGVDSGTGSGASAAGRRCHAARPHRLRGARVGQRDHRQYRLRRDQGSAARVAPTEAAATSAGSRHARRGVGRRPCHPGPVRPGRPASPRVGGAGGGPVRATDGPLAGGTATDRARSLPVRGPALAGGSRPRGRRRDPGRPAGRTRRRGQGGGQGRTRRRDPG
jgi:hypothetical protein